MNVQELKATIAKKLEIHLNPESNYSFCLRQKQVCRQRYEFTVGN